MSEGKYVITIFSAPMQGSNYGAFTDWVDEPHISKTELRINNSFTIRERMELVAEKEYTGISAIYQFLGNGVQMVSGSLFYIFAAHIFPPSDLGTIALFIAIVGLFSIVFTLGLNTAIIHFISSSLNSRVYSPGRILFRILGIGTLFAFAGMLIIYLISGYISVLFFHNAADTHYIKLLSIVLFGNIIFSILNGALIGFEKFRASALISVMIWAIYYFGAIILAYMGHSLIAIIYGWIIGLALGVIIDIVYLLGILAGGYMKKRRGIVGSRTIFNYALPVLLTAIIGYGASYTDRFVVSYLMNTYYLGIYNFALLVFSGIGFIAFPFNNITLPKFSEFFGNNQRDLTRSSVKSSSLLLSYFYIPVAMGTASLAPLILYYIAGSAYVTGQFALMIVMLIPAPFVSQNILVQAISSVRKTSYFLYSSIAALASNVIISFLLIPFIGIVGAALGFSSVYIVTFSILYRLAKRENLVSFDLKGLSKIWFSGIIMFAVVFIMMHISVMETGYSAVILPILIMTGTAVYILVSGWLRVFSDEEKEYILSMFPEKMLTIRKLIKFMILR